MVFQGNSKVLTGVEYLKMLHFRPLRLFIWIRFCTEIKHGCICYWTLLLNEIEHGYIYYCCPDFLRCPAHLSRIGWATSAIWAAIKKYSLFLPYRWFSFVAYVINKLKNSWWKNNSLFKSHLIGTTTGDSKVSISTSWQNLSNYVHIHGLYLSLMVVWSNASQWHEMLKCALSRGHGYKLGGCLVLPYKSDLHKKKTPYCIFWNSCGLQYRWYHKKVVYDKVLFTLHSFVLRSWPYTTWPRPWEHPCMMSYHALYNALMRHSLSRKYDIYYMQICK